MNWSFSARLSAVFLLWIDNNEGDCTCVVSVLVHFFFRSVK